MANYRMYDADLVNSIKQIYEINPKSCAKRIAKDAAMLGRLLNAIDFETSHISEMIYAVLNPDKDLYCGQGRRRRFRNINVGWLGCGDRSCLSCKAEAKQKNEATNLNRYGVTNPMHNDSIKSKQIASCRSSIENQIQTRKETYLNKYGVDHYWKTPEGQAKRRQSLMKKFGVDNPSKSKEIQNKRTETFINRFGSHPSQNQQIKDNVLNYFRETYGVDNPSQLTTIRDKAKKTTIERYGVEFAAQNEEIKDKIKNTLLERYGVTSAMHVPLLRQKNLESRRLNFFDNLLARTEGKAIPLFNLDDYNGVDQDYKWMCIECSNEFVDNLDDGWIPKCNVCFPKVKSLGEQEIFEYVSSLSDQLVIRNSRSIIKPFELDIYVPTKNLAIEFNGVYRHSENSGHKDRNYHLYKYQLASERGIKLLHIFDCEWFTKKHIIKSKISYLFGHSTKIYARQCIVKKISNTEKDCFLNENHLQGTCVSNINYGLFFQEKLVAVMTFGKSRFSKLANVELLRYCSKVYTTVTGGASKILQAFLTDFGNTSIVSYCDLRFGNGNMYKHLGFEYVSQTSPNYWYHNDSRQLEHRIKYQKHKLKKKLPCFDDRLTEWENMQQNGYDRIWDCGSLVFVRIG